MIFENEELNKTAKKDTIKTTDSFIKTTAKKFNHEKLLIKKELEKHSTMRIYTKPENLTIKTINKYLAIKSKNLI